MDSSVMSQITGVLYSECRLSNTTVRLHHVVADAGHRALQVQYVTAQRVTLELTHSNLSSHDLTVFIVSCGFLDSNVSIADSLLHSRSAVAIGFEDASAQVFDVSVARSQLHSALTSFVIGHSDLSLVTIRLMQLDVRSERSGAIALQALHAVLVNIHVAASELVSLRSSLLMDRGKYLHTGIRFENATSVSAMSSLLMQHVTASNQTSVVYQRCFLTAQLEVVSVVNSTTTLLEKALLEVNESSLLSLNAHCVALKLSDGIAFRTHDSSLLCAACVMLLNASNSAYFYAAGMRARWIGNRTADSGAPYAYLLVDDSPALSSRAVCNICFDTSTFAGFRQIAVSDSNVAVGLTVYCSVILATYHPTKWRPLSKTHVGFVPLWARLPEFYTYSLVDPDAECAVQSASWSDTATRSAATPSVTAAASATLTHWLTASASTAVTATVVLTESVSGTASRRELSATETAEATVTRVAAERVERRRQARDVGYAAAVGAAIAATSFSSVWSGLAAQRVAFAIRTSGVDCGALGDGASGALEDAAAADVDWLSSPTRLSLGAAVGAWHRGAVAGNVAVCACVGVAVAVAVSVATVAGRLPAAVAILRLRVRHVVSVPVTVLLQPTFASGVLLLQLAAASGGSAAVDAAVGALGVVCVAAACAVLVLVLDPRRDRFGARAEARARLPLAVLGGEIARGCGSAAVGLYRWWTAERWAWRSKRERSGFVERWGYLFGELCAGRQWWPLLDTCVSLLLGGLAVAVPVTAVGCTAWKWSVVGVACAGVVLLLALQPLSSVRAMWSGVAMASVTALLAVLSAQEADPDAIEAISIAAAVWPWLDFVFVRVSTCCSGRLKPLQFESDDVCGWEGAGDRDVSGEDFPRKVLTSTSTSSVAAPPTAAEDGSSVTPPVRRRIATDLRKWNGKDGKGALGTSQGVALKALISIICAHQQAAGAGGRYHNINDIPFGKRVSFPKTLV